MSFGLWVIVIFCFASLAFSLINNGILMIMKEEQQDRVEFMLRFINSALITACIIWLLCLR